MNKKELNDYYTLESDKIFKYWTDKNRYDNNNECLLGDSRTVNQVNYRNISLPNKDLVDIESDLTNRTRRLSKNPEKKFNPLKQNLKVEDINQKNCDSDYVNTKKVDYKYCSLVNDKFICK